MARFTLTFLFQLVIAGCFAQSGKLIVIVKGIQLQKGGELSTAIFDSENFLNVGKQLWTNETTITAEEIHVVFDNVPAGTYAVVSFQDIDKDKKLKSNFIGYPTEPVGFSRDAKIKYGPPQFDDAKVTIEKDKALTIQLTLK